MHIDIKTLLLDHRLKEALDKLTEYASSTDNWQIKSEIENLKTTYGFMIQYAAQGVNDPDRKELYNQLFRNAFAINDRTEPVSYTHLTLPTMMATCRSRWSPYH